MLINLEETRRLGDADRDWSPGPKRQRKPEVSDELVRMVEAEIIPRLMLAHRTVTETQPPARPDAGAVAAFADLAVAGDVRPLSRFVDAERDRGVDHDAILLDLLAPAARLLGDRWLTDEASFADVTIGLTCLHRLLHEVTDLRDEIAPGPGAHRALLMPAAGEQHTFGLLMVEAFMRNAGWEVWPVSADPADAARLVRQRRFDVIGVSASCDARLDAIATLIRDLRRASCNEEVSVLVGGPLFVEHPEYAAVVGADAGASDAREACRVAERLVAKPSVRQGKASP